MKISSILEDKKLPGAVNGIKVMSPEEFIKTKDEEVDESEVDDFTHPGWAQDQEGIDDALKNYQDNKKSQDSEQDVKEGERLIDLGREYGAPEPSRKPRTYSGSSGSSSSYRHPEETDFMDPIERRLRKEQERIRQAWAADKAKKGMAEAKSQKKADRYHINKDGKPATLASYKDKESAIKDRDAKYPGAKVHQVGPRGKVKGEFEEGVAEAVTMDRSKNPNYPNDPATVKHQLDTAKSLLSDPKTDPDSRREAAAIVVRLEKSGMAEATKLPAQQREFGGQEFQDYMKRIQGTPDVDKKTGQVKLDKKGKEKYVSGKTKQDKYKMPYMHRSSVVKYYDEEGKRYREEQVIEALKNRPKKLLKQNEKMKHSNGELEQFFNVGFAALVGVAVDEDKDKLIIVNTCPGAGSCKIDCFAMKGGKVQFEAAWLSDGRILTYLLNDPTGFFSQLSSEISKEESLGLKGNYNVSIRWHDAGDFFSPEYYDLAMKMAKKHPNVKFYAYTKVAGAALGNKPKNFIINWSEGAHTSQEKQVKAADPNLDTTKNSRIVPTDAFDDLLVKDKKGNLVKGDEGQWQIQSDKLPELKERLGKMYQISPNSILSYKEYIQRPKISGLKYNVIVAPGEGDISANDPDVISTLLLRH